MNEFKLGEAVYLRGGSSRLTITHIDNEDRNNVQCDVVWHDKDGIEHRSNYPAASLTRDDPDYIPPAAFNRV